MKLFHCVVVMGAAMTGSCGGQATRGGRTIADDAAASDATAPDTPEAGTLEAGADRVSCCGDAGTDGGGPCFDNSRYPPLQWSCLSYDPPLGCTCNIVVAIL